MSSVDEQLRSEIASIEEHIARTGDRFVATRLVAQLLPPLRRLARHITPAERESALTALRRARDRFSVNGQLSVEIDALRDLFGDDGEAEGPDGTYSEALLPPSEDPGDTAEGTAQALFEDEDEEPEVESSPSAEATDEAEGHDGDEAGDMDVDDLFPDGEEAEEGGDSGPRLETEPSLEESPRGGAEPAGADLSPDELFEVPERPAAESAGHAGRPPLPQRAPKKPAPGMPRRELEEIATSVNIFSHTVALDDLQAALDLTVPAQDLGELENRLRARLSDKVVATLRDSRLAEGQYILMPRLARFVHEGALLPCTVKNLAKAFYKLFGDLRDLRPYVNDRTMTAETPQLEWALITAESPRESLNKSYMEQNQYLRYLATALGIPSHLIRRRTLVEAVYDAVVAHQVLGKSLQYQTLDWTASSSSKNDFICVYSADEGIRVRQLARTTRHPALGVSPNW